MKRNLILFVISMLVVGSIGAAPLGVDPAESKLLGVDPQSDEAQTMIVRFSSSADLDALRELPQGLSRGFFRFFSSSFNWVPGEIRNRFRDFGMMSMELTGEEAARLARRPDVLYIEPNYMYELLEPVPRAGQPQEAPAGEYQYGLENMGVTAALHEAGYTGQGVKVAVIDSGIASLHQDLRVAGGWNYVDEGIYYGDGVGHGTHVGGIIAAQRNGYGVVGVAPDADLYSLVVCTILGCSGEAIINSVQWSLDHHMDVINLSLGGIVRSVAMNDVMDIAYARGVLIVAAAGNEGRGTDSVLYPAKFDSVVAVSAVDEENKIANFSSRGPDVELAAPGVDVYSTLIIPFFHDYYYEYLSGTSMASPHIAGLAALIMEANPGISNLEVREKMKNMALDLGAAGRDNDYGWGLGQVDRPPDQPDEYAPVADAGGPYRGAVGEPVQFSAEGTVDLDDNLLDFRWDFGDGSSGQGEQVEHVYKDPGDYAVTLEVSDRDGLQDQAQTQVLVRAGVIKEMRISAADAGYLREPDDVNLGRDLLAGRSLRRDLHGIALFPTPGHGDIFLLSMDLELTGSRDRNLPESGTIRAGLLPEEIAITWPDFSFGEAAGAPIEPLEPEILLSNLQGQVGDGVKNVFSAPHEDLTVFESEFATGAMAFRVDLNAEDSESMSWSQPELVVRFIDHVSQAQYPPIVDAGVDRRAYAGSIVTLDGSGTHDPEGDALSYEWVQTGGNPIELDAADTAIASFTAPDADDILVFELRASDGVFSDTDQVNVFLNGAPAEVNTVVLRPGHGHAGYVHEHLSDLNFFDKPVILSGIQDWLTEDDTDFRTFGVLQFDLSDIPSGSQVVSATLELTGAWKWVGKPAKFNVVILDDSVDLVWEDLDYPTVVGAEDILTLYPELDEYNLGENEVNSFSVAQNVVADRRASTDRITLRVDGPRISYGYGWMWFTWWSGNRADTAHMAPRLIVEYAALEPVEPTSTPTAPPTTATPTPTAPPPTDTPTEPTPTATSTLTTPTPTAPPPTNTPTPPPPTETPTEPPPTATPTATSPPVGEAAISISPVMSTSIDFSGREYFTARKEIHGNESASPLEIGDAQYEPSGREYSSGWRFADGGEFVDEGVRYVAAQHGNAWGLHLIGDAESRSVDIYVTINHNSRGGTEYLVTAGDASETITKTDLGRDHYVITIRFVGEVEVRMENVSDYSDSATFWLAAAVDGKGG